MSNELSITRLEKWRWVFIGRLVTQIPFKVILQQQIEYSLDSLDLYSNELQQALYEAVLQHCNSGHQADDEIWRQMVPASSHPLVERSIDELGDSIVSEYQGYLTSHWRKGAEGLVDAPAFHTRLGRALSAHVDSLRRLFALGLSREELLRGISGYQRDWADQVPLHALLTDEERALMLPVTCAGSGSEYYE